jgi:hypothetical protein
MGIIAQKELKVVPANRVGLAHRKLKALRTSTVLGGLEVFPKRCGIHLGLKRTPTATRFAGIRVVEFEAPTEQIGGEVDFGSLQVEHTLHIDGDFDAFGKLKDVVVFRNVLVEAKSIRQPGTPATANPHP